MAQPEVHAPPQFKAPPAQWNDGETVALVDYLYDHRSEAEGAGNFKQQLKNTFHAIEKYRNQTGVHWDNESGAGIDGPVAAAIWTLYIKSNNLMRPFCNKGWEHYEKMQTIFPLGGTRGRHVFHPGGAAPSITNPDSDLVDAAARSSSTATTTTSITSSTPACSTAMSTTTSMASSSHARSTAASTTAGSNASKRPYSDVMGDAESVGSTHMLSMQPLSTTLVSSPPSKKPRTPVTSQNSRMTKITSAAKAAKITLAAAVVGMQGSINWLTDVFKWFHIGVINV
ncbi:hypothetical protein EDD22DRAFT_962965 [Suillus occidentalis]|nr:hypothetical protein EDD22DRAFT_962965 [Suillus occidentalis]